ncbi:hypothetical protein E2C01_043053 [Portunus trituberculatus]|uniref:Uncharacterized protein n=1 Tax=Portunus trituberculatus TaxID=210409 RepID=A0A5B7FV98_PORTR|nr:hypothetical protein [Portunus trituberculatus]
MLLCPSGFKTELLHSRNIADIDTDYIPNFFNNHLEFSAPELLQIPPPRWFVAYRNGLGNFSHASRYFAKEIGTNPEGNLKKYGKGVLVRAKDATQARMLQHFPYPTDGMFEMVKAHPTFNYSKGCVYSQDIYEFPEEEILAMCPSSVHKVTKMRNSSNMVLLMVLLQCFSCYGARRELLYRQKDGTGATSYASLGARSSAEYAGPKISSATSHSLGAGGPAVRSADRATTVAQLS